jgi:glutamate--cysteine ligase
VRRLSARAEDPMTLTRDDPGRSPPLEDVAQLIEYFRAGEKPRERWRVGTENEKLGLLADTLEPVPYEGPRGIRALLERLLDHGFEPLSDADNLVGLERGGASITLEPGGQLELSGAPLSTIHQTCAELHEHLHVLKAASAELDLAWLGVGLHPFVPIERAPRMPRERYAIMRDYLGRRDRLGLHMMHLTAGVQASFDYASEADLARKLRVALAAAPIQTALWANSSISEGAPNGFESRRALIWRHTDRDRCGLLPFVFEQGWGEGAAYRRYVEWALDVPMFFIVRDGHHIPLSGLTFREYLHRGHERWKPTVADWPLHLTTLFPEVRVKHVVEIRGADATSPGLVCAMPALWKGLLYDEIALAAAERRLGQWSFAEVDRLQLEAARSGLKAQAPDAPLAVVARELVDLAAGGLRRQAAAGSGAPDESGFLDPLYEVLERGTSPARDLLERWEGIWGRDRRRLVDHVRY